MKKMRLAEFAIINPTVSLKKGEKYKYVSMSAVNGQNRYVKNDEIREYTSGGTRFKNMDVLFARITPCLENGKIAQYVDDEKGSAFGSTEFFVFRQKPNVSLQSYIFYLVRSSIVRKPAEASMSGASGRQRADISVVENIEIPAYPLNVQRKIAAVLSAYDDLIENNTRRIKALEEAAQTLYREWFVEFRYPGHEDVPLVDSELGMIPQGWEVSTLGDCIELSYGKGLRKSDRVAGEYPVYGSSGIIDSHNEYLVEGPGIIVGRKGNVGSVFWSNIPFNPIDTTYYVITDFSLYYVYYDLLYQPFVDTHAAVPGLNRDMAYSLSFLIPPQSLINKFDLFISNSFATQRNLTKQNEILREARDGLLPRLVAGEVDVSALDVV